MGLPRPNLPPSMLNSAGPRVPDSKSPLKELYDSCSHRGNLEYRCDRVEGATSQDALQWRCRYNLSCSLL